MRHPRIRPIAGIVTVALAAGLTVQSPAAPAAGTGCPEPTLYQQAPGDNTADAAGRGQLFERVHVPGITDMQARTASAAFVDVNHDGLPDLVTINRNVGLNLFMNRGCFLFEEAPVTIDRPAEEDGDVQFGAVAMAVADLQDDGIPDFVLGASGGSRMQLLISKAFDEEQGLVLEDFAVRMGVENTGAYVHGQISIGDVDADGWLDLAVGGEQIGDATNLGRPLSRMYVYRPAPDGGFTDGRFEDIAGTPLLPDFGGVDPDTCDPEVDRAVSSLLLRDLDDDGDLDLVQASQADMNPIRTTDPGSDCAPGMWRIGVFAFENQLADEGELRFREVGPGPGTGWDDGDEVLPEQGRMRYDYALQRYQPIERATSAYVVQTSDVDNDTDLDVMTVVSTDPEWNAQTERLGGKFWRNEGRWRFPAATEEHGLEPLRWTYAEWFELWGTSFEPNVTAPLFCAASSQRGECATMPLEEHTFMAADLVAADWDNDGWEDLVYFDRHEIDRNYGVLRNAFIRNRGGGSFEAMPTTWSGLSENMIAGEAVDLDGDGLLELFVAARNAGSGQINQAGPVYPLLGQPDDQDADRVYWNTGEKGAAGHHWLRVHLGGLPDRKLVGSVVIARDAATGEVVGRRDYTTVTSYKTAHDPFAHFGLGDRTAVSLEIRLPDTSRRCTPSVDIDRVAHLDVTALPAC